MKILQNSLYAFYAIHKFIIYDKGFDDQKEKKNSITKALREKNFDTSLQIGKKKHGL
jgi:hypothetical protein